MLLHSPLIIVMYFMLIIPLYADDMTLITFADGRPDGGIRQSAAHEDGLDAPGNVFVFDQKLLDATAENIIGRNAGFCIRTDPGTPDFSSTDHPGLPDDPDNNYGQCTWTLDFYEHSGYTGSLTVSGREADLGTSTIAIIGGTGDFIGVTGVMLSTPLPQTEGILFRQELIFK